MFFSSLAKTHNCLKHYSLLWWRLGSEHKLKKKILPAFKRFPTWAPSTECRGLDSTRLVLDWLVVVMDLKKVEWFFVDEVSWLFCPSITSFYVSWFLARKFPSIIGVLHILLPCGVDQSLVWSCGISHLKNSSGKQLIAF